MPYVAETYVLPPGSTVTPNTTIESAKFNTFLNDIATAQNAARPVVGGGTGAATSVAGNDGLNTQGADIASGATTNLALATGVYVNITGTTTITSFGTVLAGSERVLTFTGILTLTYNATSLILPGAANITTAAGDVGTFRSLGGGNWRCVSYLRANGGNPSNSISGTTIILKQSAAPAPTAEGDIQWDTDDNVVLIGDGAAAKTFVPIPASTAAGDIEYFTAALIKARLAKGTAGQVLRMNSGATAPEWGTPPFRTSFESTQQTITSAGLLTLAHGLGVKPKLYAVVLQCLTAEHGYSIGDEVMCAQTRQTAGGGGERGVSLVPDATNLNIRFAAPATVFNLIHKTTGAAVEVTNANWALVARAWA